MNSNVLPSSVDELEAQIEAEFSEDIEVNEDGERSHTKGGNDPDPDVEYLPPERDVSGLVDRFEAYIKEQINPSCAALGLFPVTQIEIDMMCDLITDGVAQSPIKGKAPRGNSFFQTLLIALALTAGIAGARFFQLVIMNKMAGMMGGGMAENDPYEADIDLNNSDDVELNEGNGGIYG